MLNIIPRGMINRQILETGVEAKVRIFSVVSYFLRCSIESGKRFTKRISTNCLLGLSKVYLFHGMPRVI
jgi:hypothetical protein